MPTMSLGANPRERVLRHGVRITRCLRVSAGRSMAARSCSACVVACADSRPHFDGGTQSWALVWDCFIRWDHVVVCRPVRATGHLAACSHGRVFRLICYSGRHDPRPTSGRARVLDRYVRGWRRMVSRRRVVSPISVVHSPSCSCRGTSLDRAGGWIGVYGLSYMVWVVAALGAFRHRAFWILFLLLPAFSWLLPLVDTPDRRALLVQAEGVSEAQTELFNLANPAEKVDVAVLPELAYLNSAASAIKATGGPADLARRLDAPVVFGAVEGNYFNGPFDNVAAVLDEHGELLGTFPKQRPVPLVRDGTPGTRRPIFPVSHGVLGVGICYDFDAPEVAASLVRQGATVLVAPTYDAMSWSGVQHDQHELLVRLRAVENDRWILRSASSGRSEAVSPHGVPSAEGIAVGARGSLTVAFGHRTTQPLGGQCYILGPVCAGGTCLFVLVFGVRRWRSKGLIQTTSTNKMNATPTT